MSRDLEHPKIQENRKNIKKVVQKTWLLVHRKERVNQIIQAYVNPPGISTHPVCYCVCVDRKRATAEEGLRHPWLNPHQHLHPVKASSLDEPETCRSDSDPESPARSPEPDLIGSYLLYPGQGELKTGRPAFSFSDPRFPTRPEIQQELMC